MSHKPAAKESLADFPPLNVKDLQSAYFRVFTTALKKGFCSNTLNKYKLKKSQKL